MDYILKQLDKKINFYSTTSLASMELANYYRIQIEYKLLFLMSILWSENYYSIDTDEKKRVLNKVLQPTIGSIVEIIRILDVNRQIFGTKQFKKTLNRYPALRNERIGHGFVFEDAVDIVCNELSEISASLSGFQSNPLNNNYDIVLVTNNKDGAYNGVNYKSNGDEYLVWQCHSKVKDFEINHVYALDDKGKYFRLSPFILVTFDEEFYLYRDIQDRLLGKVRYNQLLRTGSNYREWDVFDWEVENDGTRRKTANGTVINVFENNYRKYISLDVRKDVVDFALKNKSSVCATIWGHGGVGKTATVQSVCDELIGQNNKRFDYIIFASAKDRYYSYYDGAINQISDSIDSYSALIRVINMICGREISDDIQLITEGDEKLLIIVDDFETFPREDQGKIGEFIKKLNINYHKVLITTRSNFVIGHEIKTNELNTEQAGGFLVEVLKTELPEFNVVNIEKQLLINENLKNLHGVTSGRPLFIFQFAFILAQTGSFQSAFKRKISRSDQAAEFLYGRLYEYLSKDAKRLFVTISQLVTENDLTNLTEKLQYVTSMENKEDEFNSAFQELIKLRIIQVFENGFFGVYSKEILQIMLNYFSRDAGGKRDIISRLKQVTKDKKLDNNHALLENANSARYSKSEEEVNSLYRQILNRASCPMDVKVMAILNLADYFFNNRGQKDFAINIFRDFEHIFLKEPLFAKMYASYCWATDRKGESIKILRELFSIKPAFEDNDLRLELLGLSLTYRSISAIQRKEEIKLQKRYDEISYVQFGKKNEEIKKTFREIVIDGKMLLNNVRKDGVGRLRASARQNVLTGLYQLTNVSIRIQSFELGEEICKFGESNSKDYLRKEFANKKLYIQHRINP